MKSLSSSSQELQGVDGELLDGSGFETEDPAADFNPSEFLTEEDSEQ